jgi:hypothetical protein
LRALGAKTALLVRDWFAAGPRSVHTDKANPAQLTSAR